MSMTLNTWTETRLRWLIAGFFLALLVPTAILINQAYSQLKWEAFHRHRVMAEELTSRINRQLLELISNEEKRSFTDYSFLNVVGDPAANLVQRSPLAAYPAKSSFEGTIGYFQIDSLGVLTTPLLPSKGGQASIYGISNAEWKGRKTLQKNIYDILSQNKLIQGHKLASLKPAKQAKPVRRKKKIKAASKNESSSSSGLFSSETQNDLAETVGAIEAEESLPQAAFDKLNQPRERDALSKKRSPKSLGRVEDLKLDARYQKNTKEKPATAPASRQAKFSRKRLLRKERSALPEQKLSLADKLAPTDRVSGKSNVRIKMFETEVERFEFSQLDSGHFVLFRKVWRNGQRYIQGILLDSDVVLNKTITKAFRETSLSRMSILAVAYEGNVLTALTGGTRGYLTSTDELSGSLLYQTRLSAPLNSLELIFSISSLPAGPGGTVISWVAAILLIVLCGGFYFMYSAGMKQIQLVQQQQDFVSAVSHELKTPLTSIRMYGEMLREGWASDDKKHSYYEYIHDESERLSRLISNVLQLSRMTKNDLDPELVPISVAELMDSIGSKVSSHAERAGYALSLNCSDEAKECTISVDADYFTQIIINLVDNAIKFSKQSGNKSIDIGCQKMKDGTIQFSVRDYGPGIAKDQMKKIFKLFYRAENELTRETVGTGIGLALVHQMTQAMNGKVDVVNKEPGAEFQIVFPITTGS